MKRTSFSLLLVGFIALAAGCKTTSTIEPRATAPIRAYQIITVTDDFVVEVYHNGVRVPDSKRNLLLDRFGATVEATEIEVRGNDWLVFHVVNNRLRWDGAYYFAAAGILAPGEFGFVSEASSPNWNVCDDPRKSRQFITQRRSAADGAPVPVEKPWHEGDQLMWRFAGGSWDGEPIWGRERSTWIKVVVP